MNRTKEKAPAKRWREPFARVNPFGSDQLQPLVPPQVLHFMQVPLRTSV